MGVLVLCLSLVGFFFLFVHTNVVFFKTTQRCKKGVHVWGGRHCIHCGKDKHHYIVEMAQKYGKSYILVREENIDIYYFQYLPDFLKQDKDIIFYFLSKNKYESEKKHLVNEIIDNLPDGLIQDKEFVLQIITALSKHHSQYKLYERLPTSLKDDKDIVLHILATEIYQFRSAIELYNNLPSSLILDKDIVSAIASIIDEGRTFTGLKDIVVASLKKDKDIVLILFSNVFRGYKKYIKKTDCFVELFINFFQKLPASLRRNKDVVSAVVSNIEEVEHFFEFYKVLPASLRKDKDMVLLFFSTLHHLTSEYYDVKNYNNSNWLSMKFFKKLSVSLRKDNDIILALLKNMKNPIGIDFFKTLPDNAKSDVRVLCYFIWRINKNELLTFLSLLPKPFYSVDDIISVCVLRAAVTWQVKVVDKEEVGHYEEEWVGPSGGPFHSNEEVITMAQGYSTSHYEIDQPEECHYTTHKGYNEDLLTSYEKIFGRDISIFAKSA